MNSPSRSEQNEAINPRLRSLTTSMVPRVHQNVLFSHQNESYYHERDDRSIFFMTLTQEMNQY